MTRAGTFTATKADRGALQEYRLLGPATGRLNASQPSSAPLDELASTFEVAVRRRKEPMFGRAIFADLCWSIQRGGIAAVDLHRAASIAGVRWPTQLLSGYAAVEVASLRPPCSLLQHAKMRTELDYCLCPRMNLPHSPSTFLTSDGRNHPFFT